MRQIENSAWLLAIGSGVLQVLIFPSPFLYYLCWIALAPLLVALLRARAGELYVDASGGRELLPATALQGLLLGWLAGFIWSIGSCYWIYYVMHVYGGLDAPVAAGVLLLFCIALGFHSGIFGLLLALLARGSRDRIRGALVLAPFLWVAVELARTYITSFPWDLLGTVQVDNIPLVRIATITGVYGISFEIMLVNAALAAAFLARRQRRRLMLTTAILAALTLQAGQLIRPPRFPAVDTARLVQQNIPILTSDWSADFYQATLNDLSQYSIPRPGENPGQPPPSVVVWPESPAPFFFNDARLRATIVNIARRANAYVIVTGLGVRDPYLRENPRQLFNSAALVAPSGEWVARYDKLHLVPFGEYVPFKSLLTFAEKLTREVGDFVPGTERTVFHLGPYRLGVFICYESVFPGEIRQFARNGAAVFVNVSNDGWFGESGAPEQHLIQARMRAVENNRWLLRSTNTGITASIDPYGRVVARAPRGVRTLVDVPFSPVAQTTFYARHGDWFPIVCAIISAVALVNSVRRRRSDTKRSA